MPIASAYFKRIVGWGVQTLRRAWALLCKVLLHQLPESWKLTRWCVFIQLVIIWLLCKWVVYQPPTPGVAVALLGLVAIIISVKTRSSNLEKAIWLALCTLLIIVEFSSIKLDRQLNQAEQTLLRAQERSSFQSVIQSESRHFATMLAQAKEIISGEHDLVRTPIQRVYETYEVAGELSNLAREIATENPDQNDGMRGYYKLLAERQFNAGNFEGAKKTMRKFGEAKERKWEGWQKQLRRYLPVARARETELRLRLPDYEGAAPTNVAIFLKTGILTRKAGVDSRNLQNAAQYLRKLAEDSKEIP